YNPPSGGRFCSTTQHERSAGHSTFSDQQVEIWSRWSVEVDSYKTTFIPDAIESCKGDMIFRNPMNNR
ncbi:hypothetical protein A2U01_0036299, partial [Trifolium medium]|nr:hypothetical protein [Trifolium medium]